MFPFDNNTTMALEPLSKKPPFQPYDPNPISKQDDDSPLIFSNFPSPFFDEQEDLHHLPLNQILPQYHSQSANSNPPDPITPGKSKNTKKQSLKESKTAVLPRKRTGKKDRHSKICTAQGIRDRRMRLSLQVARKFFDLQDLLGYDKASKTIEWLFNKSNKAIKDLTNSNINITTAKPRIRSTTESSECEEVACKPNTRDRESREKARARARCRTEEKMMMGKLIQDPVSSTPHDLQKLGFVDRERAPPAYAAADYSPISSDVGTIEKLLGNSSSDSYHCSSAAVSIDPNNNFMGFLGNWDLLSNDRLNYAVENQAVMPAAGNTLSIYSTTNPDFPLFHQ